MRMTEIPIVLFFLLALIPLNLFSGGMNEAEKKKGTIAFISPGTTSPFYAGVIEGAAPFAQAKGYRIQVLSPEKEDDFEGILSIVQDMINLRVTGICLCTTDDKTLTQAIKNINKAEIPVVVFNSLTPLPDLDVYAYVGYDQRKAGEKLTRYLTDHMTHPLNIAIINGLEGHFTIERSASIIEEATKNPYVTIERIIYGNWERETSEKELIRELKVNPSINTVFALSDEMALGAADAAVKAGRKDLVIVGIDGNHNAVKAVMGGSLTATVNTNRDLIGKVSIEAIINAINGEQSETRIPVETFIIDSSNAEVFQ